MTLSIAIPTYNRGAVLMETIPRLLALEPPASEIMIVDQTGEHPRHVAARLAAWNASGAIRLMRLDEPSIPRAMNLALTATTSRYVLFLDDDIIPSPSLIAAHLDAYRDSGIAAVVGQVLQPGEEPAHHDEATLRRGTIADLEFRFNHDRACDIRNVMAGNLSVERESALAIGGFDESFVAVAYRFESDFALRLAKAGGRIRFEPSASIRHLKIRSGGIRAYGDHRRSASPAHSVGDYYFARRHAPAFWRYVGRRLMHNVATRYHLRRPWTIPGKLLGEARGLLLALRLAARPPQLATRRE